MLNTLGGIGILWMALAAPIVTGYFAAKFSPYHPYYHALAAAALVVIWQGSRGLIKPIVVLVAVSALALPLSYFGARWQQQRHT